MNLLELLVEKKIINSDDVAIVEEEVSATSKTAEGILVERGLDPKVILNAKAEYLNLPVFELGEKKIQNDILKYIPEESVLHYRFVPIGLNEGVLEVGVIDADNIEALDALNFISSKINLPFKVFLISEDDFKKIVQMYKGLSQEVGKALSEFEVKMAAEAIDLQKGKKEEKKIDTIREDAPVTKIVTNILEYAVEGRASDIHIEPMQDELRVRFRVDGEMGVRLQLPMKVHLAIISRIKILSKMRLDERRKPQDGRFSATVKQRRVDLRVSTFPSYYGEKIVMRILDIDKGVVGLEAVGLSKDNLATIRRLAKKPYGIILISGPTGSGKTTTLYGMLNEFDRVKRNVLSLEDPIEYNINGVTQSQVRPEIGYTFATGLRTTLRQDPDIIMVGEIRDRETAELAIQAALTGHLVLSTIHTNNAVGVVPRLIEMGIDPYLIAPTLILAMAQRLVRKLCPDTGEAIPVEGAYKTMIDKQFKDLPEQFKNKIPKGKEVYGVQPTKECPTGTQGRIAVFEILEIDKDLERVILEEPNNVAIQKMARSKGMLSMREDAIIKSFNKIIPFQEINTLGTEFLAAENAAEKGRLEEAGALEVQEGTSEDDKTSNVNSGGAEESSAVDATEVKK